MSTPLHFPPSKPKIEATDEIFVNFGVFHLGAYRVPYMSAVLSFRQIAEWLGLVTDNPKYARRDWSIEELFQRDVDQGRVLGMVRNYLNPTLSRPQFFNSLTVVLTANENDQGRWQAPDSHSSPYPNKLDLGPISVSFATKEIDAEYPAGGSFGTLRWNRDQVSAVAIDGQHRLAAIKAFYSENKAKGASSFVSVIFLTIDPALGFLSPGELDAVKVMRSLFIDLNKHAVPVTRARNLLLDDHDPGASFVRALFGPRLGITLIEKKTDYGIHIGSEGELATCLPLNLVDWHGETKSKIDTGPYIASVLSLDWVVQRLLRANHPRRPAIARSVNPDEEDSYLKAEQDLKHWDRTWTDPKLRLPERLANCREAGRAFYLTTQDVEALASEFSAVWGRSITRLLTATPGYREVVESRIKRKTITPEFGQWYQAVADYENSKKTDLEDHLKSRLDSVCNELESHGIDVAEYKQCVNEINQLKKDNVLFYLVGQRAVVYSLIRLSATKKAASWISHLKLDPNKFADCWQDFYAYLIAEALTSLKENAATGVNILKKDCRVKRSKKAKDALVSDYFWAGSLAKRDDPTSMDFSEKAAERGAAVLLVIVCLCWYVESNSLGKSLSEVKETLANCVDNRDFSPQGTFGDELGEAVLAFLGPEDDSADSSNVSPMKFLTKILDPWDPTIAQAAAKDRLFALAAAICM